jgi:transposase
MEFVKRYESWTIEDWKKVLWSDETKINRIGSDGRQYCWKRGKSGLLDQHVDPTLKHGGGSIMIWGCMTWKGVGEMCKIQGIMDSKVYCEILELYLKKTMKNHRLVNENFYFQQDNDPKHTSHLAQQWFENNNINVLYWPPQSADLNPIEHLWKQVKHAILQYPEPPVSIHELWDRLCIEW